MFMHEGHHEEQRADGEDRLVVDRCRSGCRPCRSRAMNAVIVCDRLARVRGEVRASARRRAARSSSRRSRARRRARSRRRCPRAPPGTRRVADVWRLRRAEAVRALAQAAAAPRVIASSEIEAIVGMIRMPTMRPAGERVEDRDVDADASLQDHRRDERQREEAEDDRRDAGEHLEHRLDGAADARRSRTRSGRSPSRARAGSRRACRSR